MLSDVPAYVHASCPVSVGPSILLPKCECCQTARHMQGLVQSGFLWGYMATQMIGGSLADKYGGRSAYALLHINYLFFCILQTILSFQC